MTAIEFHEYLLDCINEEGPMDDMNIHLYIPFPDAIELFNDMKELFRKAEHND